MGPRTFTLSVLVCFCLSLVRAFVPNFAATAAGKQFQQFRPSTLLEAVSSASETKEKSATDQTLSVAPQVMATGYSQAMELATAIEEATDMALEALPVPSQSVNPDQVQIDLAFVSVSSLYDGSASPSDVVPTLLDAASSYGAGIQNILGCTNGGFLSSLSNDQFSGPPQSSASAETDSEEESDDDDTEESEVVKACRPIEREGVPGVTVTLFILPDVNVQTFHVMSDDLPDDYGRVSQEKWKESMGISDSKIGQPDAEKVEEDGSALFLVPSPAFQNDLDDLLKGIEFHLPDATLFGALASTVSSLSRARLFRYDAKEGDECIQTFADGCVGVALSGDIEVKTMIAQGAKPVGGVYQIVKGQETTISSVALDETVTELVQQAEGEEEDDDEDDDEESLAEDTKAKMAQAYAKARIPKPVLAEANFLMKTLSDDDQAFMRKALLVGLDGGGALGQTPSELARLADGKGHSFTVHQVASAGMKDGSITLSLGSVDIQTGQRLRFYVRESAFAKKEVDAIWTGYKQRVLRETPSFAPTGCLVFPTLDRGSKFFLGKPGFESEAAMRSLPTLPCIAGFYSNGIIGSLSDGTDPTANPKSTSVYGSASEYVIFGSKSGRPIYIPGRAAAEAAKAEDERAQQEAEEKRLAEEDAERVARTKSFDVDKKAPRDENGELVLRRREVHSGRAMTVSTVEWSVAEKTASPTSTLEGFMWDKETEVDRFRERVPLANLVSQCRLSQVDPTKPKPRDWAGPVKEGAANGAFVIIPECKRTEPVTGSLRKRYDIGKLAAEFAVAGVPAMSVNCDGVLFGGTLEDVTKARESTSKAALESDLDTVPPILASDLLLYPYQLYKMRLAGADAVNLLGASLEPKDLLYLTKIASSLQMQTFLTVSSPQQIDDINILPAGSINGLIVSNRELEDFSFDMTGQRALELLGSDSLKSFKEKQGDDVLILAEGRVGMISGEGDSPIDYIRALCDAGATGAIVGGGLVPDDDNKTPLQSLLDTSLTL